MKIYQNGEYKGNNIDINIKKKIYNLIENFIYTIDELKNNKITNYNPIKYNLLNSKITKKSVSDLSNKEKEIFIDKIIEDIYITTKDNNVDIEKINFSKLFTNEEKTLLLKYYDFYKSINTNIHNLLITFLDRN